MRSSESPGWSPPRWLPYWAMEATSSALDGGEVARVQKLDSPGGRRMRASVRRLREARTDAAFRRTSGGSTGARMKKGRRPVKIAAPLRL